MKTLINYILELRLMIGDLPFEKDLFNNFLKDAILDSNLDDSIYWEPMQKKVTDRYGLKVWRWFYGWCESYYILKDKGVTIDLFYDMMTKIPLDRFNRVLGAGSFGIVMSLNDDWVIKVFYNSVMEKNDKKFFEWCKNHKSKFTPNVLKMGDNWVVMEKLNMHTKKCEDLINHAGERIQGKHMEFYWCRQNNVDTSIFTEEQLKAYNWIMSCKKIFKEIHGFDDLGDFNINNIGERKNGDIIFFDP